MNSTNHLFLWGRSKKLLNRAFGVYFHGFHALQYE